MDDGLRNSFTYLIAPASKRIFTPDNSEIKQVSKDRRLNVKIERTCRNGHFVNYHGYVGAHSKELL